MGSVGQLEQIFVRFVSSEYFMWQYTALTLDYPDYSPLVAMYQRCHAGSYTVDSTGNQRQQHCS